MSSVEISQHALCLCVSDLLDDGLHADHHTGNGGGSLSGLEVDDPDLSHPQCHPHLPLQGETSPSPVCPHLSVYKKRFRLERRMPLESKYLTLF